MTFDESLKFWYSRVDFERTQAVAADLKLERMTELLGRVGHPQDRLSIVHIAGSKGKGSTAAMFAAVSQAAGLRTGLFTSPHLIDVSERIQINGQPITRDDIGQLLTEMRPHVEVMESAGNSLTFFELTTALAFMHFDRQKVQLAVIEVGLGGRFDCTNVCNPILTVITSISLEHAAILGDTLTRIAFEKAGIIKPGCPVVSGVTVPEAAEVIRSVAHERGSPLLELGTDFHVSCVPGRVTSDGHVKNSRVTITSGNETWRDLELGLLGTHQAANAGLVAMGCKILAQLGLPTDERAVRSGLANVYWPARLQVFPGRPVFVLDCAHNPVSAQALIDSLNESFLAGDHTLLFACSSDKDASGILAVLADHFNRFIFTRFHLNPRSTPPNVLATAMGKLQANKQTIVNDDPVAALATARDSKAELVVIAGSVYLAGELLPALQTTQSK